MENDKRSNLISALLGSGGSIVVNKALMRAIGLHEAIVYSELVSKEAYFAGRNQLTDEDYFFNVADNMSEDTGLSGKQIRSAVNELVRLKLIATKVKGIPARKYYKVLNDGSGMGKVFDLIAAGKQIQQFGKKGKTSCAKKEKLDVPKGNGNNTNVIILKNNTKESTSNGAFDERVLWFLEEYESYTGNKHRRINADVVWIEEVDDLDESDFRNAVYEFMERYDGEPDRCTIEYFNKVAVRYCKGIGF